MNIALEKLGRFQPGMVSTRKRLSKGEETVRAIDLPSLAQGEVNWDDLSTVNPKRKLDAYVVRSGDLLIPLRPPLTTVLISDPPLRSIVVGTVAIFRADPTRALPEYVAWLFQQPVLQHQAEKNSRGTIVFFPLKELRTMTVPVPTLEIQERIARAWRLQQDMIRLERQRLEHLEAYYRGLNQRIMNTTITNQTSSQPST